MPNIKSMRCRVGGLLLTATLVHASTALAGNAPDAGNEGQRAPHGPPPQVALDACSKLSEGAACSFTGKRGETITGSCHVPPQQSALACIPAHPPMQAPSKDDDRPSRDY